MFTYIYALLIDKNLCECLYILIKFVCYLLFMPFIWRSLDFFGLSILQYFRFPKRFLLDFYLELINFSFYFKKSNLSHHIKSSHEGKKYECTYEGCDRKLCTKVSRKTCFIFAVSFYSFVTFSIYSSVENELLKKGGNNSVMQ